MFTTKGGHRSFSYNIKNLVKQGQNDKIKSSINGMAPSDLVDSSKTSLLHLAAKYNNHDLTKDLIKIKCNVNLRNTSQMSPLMVAASNSSFKTAQILIEAKADIYATNSTNKSALNLLLNNKKIPQYLINCCFEKLKTDDPSDEAIAERLLTANCPLHIVVHLKKSSITRKIINSYDQIDPQQLRAAMDSALKHQHQDNVRVLLQSGAVIDISNKHSLLFLDTVCESEFIDEFKLELIKAFLERVTDWNYLEEGGLHILESIFKHGTKPVIELFLQYNINEYVKNKFRGHDLLINIFGNRDSEAKKLLKYLKFDVNSRGENGLTALHFAAETSDLTSVQTLLGSGANPNIQDFHGRVPLSLLDSYISSDDDDSSDEDDHVLESNDDNMNSPKIKIIELLLQSGADPQLDMQSDDMFWWFQDDDTLKMQLMLAQLAIDESMGKPIGEMIRQDFNNFPGVKIIYEACCQQLEKLKGRKIHGSITLYNILVTDAAKIADSIRDQEALEAIRNEIEQFNYYYASKLKSSVTRILHTIDLREKATEFICETTGWPNSQYIIIEKILSYLTYKDLLVFD